MSQDAVTEYLVSLIAKQVGENSLVVWYGPAANYMAVAERLEIPAGLLPIFCVSCGQAVKFCTGSEVNMGQTAYSNNSCAPHIRQMPTNK